MPPIPVVCNSCGRFFFAQNLVGGAGTVTFSNVGYGRCPACGGLGRVLDGTYEFVGDAARLLSGPQWTQERLRHVAAVLDDVAHSSSARPGVTAEDVLEKLKAAEPSLAARFKPKSSADLVAWLTLLLMVVQAVLSLLAQQGMSEKDVEKVVRAVMEQGQRHPQTASPPAPKRPPPAPPHTRHEAAKSPRSARPAAARRTTAGSGSRAR